MTKIGKKKCAKCDHDKKGCYFNGIDWRGKGPQKEKEEQEVEVAKMKADRPPPRKKARIGKCDLVFMSRLCD